ncbi:MAG: replication-associated recombination protein A [Actinomycetes bacterium]
MSEDLFADAASRRLASRGPLAARLRPFSLDDVVGQPHLVGPGGALRVLAESDRLTSVILWGPPGSGKTTLARILAEASSKTFESLSAVTAGVRDVRDVIDRARQRLGEHGTGTVLFLDEVHRFNRSQQDLLLPSVEEGLVTLIGATTENPYFEVNAPLLSRSTLWRLTALDASALETLAKRGLQAEGAEATDEAIELLVEASDGDARALLTTLEVAIALAKARTEPGEAVTVEGDTVASARDGRVLHQGRDEHYDQVSALIKSIRGSDPDAALYWLARLLEAGESPRFISRRLMILASEDIGMADPMSLVFAESAARAVEVIGLPEAALTLAHSVVHLSLAPKSNSVTLALAAAQSDVRSGPFTSVPAHLCDGHYRGAENLGHGVGYRYPHDDPSGWVRQRYLPDELGERRYYQPTTHGREQTARRWVDEASSDGPSAEPEVGDHDPR